VSELVLADLLRRGAEKLQNAGVDTPREEARRLFSLVTGYTAATLIAKEHDTVSESIQSDYDVALGLRADRHPFAHIAGRTHFFGLALRSDSRALIPRADSECVVELALSLIPETAAWHLADLGTGTGALLAALLSQRPQTTGTAIDQSASAIDLANDNLCALGFADRIELLHGSWAGWNGWGDCELIISNPPYICSDVIPDLEPEVRDYDPMDALDGGRDGLDAYREIIELAAAKMKPGAHLVLEIGFDQKLAVSDLLQQAGFETLQHKKDLGGNDRAISITKT